MQTSCKASSKKTNNPKMFKMSLFICLIICFVRGCLRENHPKCGGSQIGVLWSTWINQNRFGVVNLNYVQQLCSKKKWIVVPFKNEIVHNWLNSCTKKFKLSLTINYKSVGSKMIHCLSCFVIITNYFFC